MKKRVNLHIYSSNIKNETRIFKETESIIRLGLADHIYIIGVHSDDLLLSESLDLSRDIHRVKLFMSRFNKSKLIDSLKFIEFLFIVVFRYLKYKPIFVNLHSLSVLPLAPFFKTFSSSKVIYDTHELETGKARLGGIIKRISISVEKFLVRWVDTIVAVSPSISKWYQNQFPNIEVYTIRNIPYNNQQIKPTNHLKVRYSIEENEILYIYQGLISRDRGIDLLINAFAGKFEDKHIMFMGFGESVDEIIEYSKKYSNIHFHPAVNFEQISQITSGADIGFSLIKNDCINHFYCLPNKLFEYIISGVPVIVSDFPDMSEIVVKNDFGWSCQPESQNLLNLINSITMDDVLAKKENIYRNNKKFDWYLEEQYYPQIFHL